MFKLLKLAFVVGALVAVWMLVPLGGRTLDARWTAAGGPVAFARATWADLDRALSSDPAPAPKSKAKPGTATRPTEAHTDRDRQAVDKILAEHLRN
jgi:hypothetical protein